MDYGIVAKDKERAEFALTMNASAGYGAVLNFIFLIIGVLSVSTYATCEAVEHLTRHQKQKGGGNFVSTSTLASKLSLEQKVGQMLQIRIYAQDADPNNPEYIAAREEIKKYHIGSVDLGAHMLGPNLIKGSPVTVASVLNQLQRDCDIPLLVGADLERGLASRVAGVPEFPLPLAFGAAENVKLAEEFGRITGQESRAVGIHWAYAPVADVSIDPNNSVIANRSFGESPHAVGDFVAAFIRGAHKQNLLVTAKHFPGQGDSSEDPHVNSALIGVDLARLKQVDLPPFEKAIAAGVDAIMIAHAYVPALDPDPNRIATTSPKVIDGHLRNELGFNGVVITDALEMRGLTSLYPNSASPTAQAALDAIKAGADVLMLPTDLDGAYHAIINAVRTGEISESRIDQSVIRILQLKAKLGLDKNRFVDLDNLGNTFANTESIEFAQHVADESVTLVKNDGKLLPLQPYSKDKTESNQRLVVLILADSAKGPLGRDFEAEIRARRPDAKIFKSYYDNRDSDAAPDEVSKEVARADAVVIAAFVTHLPGKKRVVGNRIIDVIGLGGPSGELLEQTISAAGKKTIVVALGTPFLIGKYPQITNYICTFSTAQTSEISAVRAIFGEIQNNAKLPVTLPGVAPRGFSKPWPKKRGDWTGVSGVGEVRKER
jgi:beta-N-acetylhexosaminidase